MGSYWRPGVTRALAEVGGEEAFQQRVSYSLQMDVRRAVIL